MPEYDAILKRLEALEIGEPHGIVLMIHAVRAAVGLRQALDRPLVSTNVDPEVLRELQGRMDSFDYCVTELVQQRSD